MPNYRWPAPNERRIIGKPYNRIDGLLKASGRATYASDVVVPDMLYGAILTCPYAHARVKSIDVSAAESMSGVAAVEVIATPGTEIQWAGAEVAAVAAVTEEIARDAIRAIKVEYEVLPHFVDDENLQGAGTRAKPSGERIEGDPEQAAKEADVIHEGYYAIPVLTHCCLEPHGQVIQWNGDRIEYWPSTQNVSGIGGDLAKALEVPASNVHVQMHSIGGGFGSKFNSDVWGVVAAKLSRKAGGKPVKLFLDRQTELEIAGCRPSAYARIKVGAKKDGSVILWESDSWATGGMTGGGMPPIPYIFTGIPNKRLNHTAVNINAGPARAWRAPNHPQAALLTMAALEDLAAKLGMDPIEFFKKNADLTARPEVYRYQLDKAAELAEWKKLWHPRGQSGPGRIKRGLGVSLHTWGGGGHRSECRCRIHPDGSVDVELGSQDLGTGTRTVIAMVAAESLGLKPEDINVRIGDNRYPPSNASGGSTTVGGVSSSTRKATLNALEKLFAVVAPELGVQPDDLEAVEGQIRAKSDPSKRMSWRDACRKLGAQPIEAMGDNDPRNPMGLHSSGVGGVQIADVSVDTETGLVTLNRLVAVQDCGMIINPKTAESQIYGGCIMAICGALYEVRVLDKATGRFLNADMEFYKLAGIKDIGEIIVHLDRRPEHDQRGVIGLGEPPVISGIAAISNAVANAIGVRVPRVPLTPKNVLAALQGRKA